MILAGDIGGTKTVIALYELDGDKGLVQERLETYPSGDYLSLEAILREFLSKPAPLTAACFGVAGPVVGGQSRTTNLPWNLSETKLSETLGIEQVKLLNDLEAAAFGMLFVGRDDYVELNPGVDKGPGNIAVIAAGTGLGEAILYWDGTSHQPIASEGGHADFAPRTDREIELLKFLRERFHGHVSYERILSGPGLVNLYQFLRDRGYGEEPAWLAEELREGDPAAAISRVGLAKQHPLCEAALEMFAAIYGAEAGNLALKCLAVGGVYIGGGIAPKILPALQEGALLDGFLDKGRFSGLVKEMPVRIVTNPRAPLIGAANFAKRLLRG